MGRNYGPKIKFTHFNDCSQSGCPGHTIRRVTCRSSDVLSFEIDGKPEYYFDENVWDAMLKATEAMTEMYRKENEQRVVGEKG